MATIKLTIDGRRIYSDGRIPIIFRLTSQQKCATINTDIRVLPIEWDAEKLKVTKAHLGYKSLNLHLKQRLLQLERKLLEMGLIDSEKDVAEIKKALLNDGKEVKMTFYTFAKQEIQNLRDQERFGNASVYETAVNKFIKYTGESIIFEQINYNVISGFDLAQLKKGLCRNTIAIYMREIRALLNLAIKKGLMERKDYPFYNFRIRTDKTVNRAISKIDLLKIKKLHLKQNSVAWHWRNIFFLIFNLIGISIIDLILLEKSNVQNGRIVYRRCKTGKMYSIKITAEANRIIELYRDENSKHLISYFKFDDVAKCDIRKEAGLRIASCNAQLRKIGRLCGLPIPLTTYVARYSWANVAKSLGYPKDQIAEALGHEYGNRITGIYLDNYGNEVIDEMNEKVTGVV